MQTSQHRCQNQNRYFDTLPLQYFPRCHPAHHNDFVALFLDAIIQGVHFDEFFYTRLAFIKPEIQDRYSIFYENTAAVISPWFLCSAELIPSVSNSNNHAFEYTFIIDSGYFWFSPTLFQIEFSCHSRK